MIYGKGAHMAAVANKYENDKAKALYAGRQAAIDNNQVFETDAQIKALSLDEVAKRMTAIKVKPYSDWSNTDNARWERLSWRAKKLGVHNPVILTRRS